MAYCARADSCASDIRYIFGEEEREDADALGSPLDPFDVLNSCKKIDRKKLKPIYCLHVEEKEYILHKTTNLMEKIQQRNISFLPCQHSKAMSWS